jgi:tRNA pseudouridine55 synthase
MISEFRITQLEMPEVSFFLTCSKGAYVRALCDEAGKRLGCGATLSSLVRTRIGPFRLANALTRNQVDRLPCDLLERLLLSHDPLKHETLSRN